MPEHEQEEREGCYMKERREKTEDKGGTGTSKQREEMGRGAQKKG